MELFIHIPTVRQERRENVFSILFLSALLIIGLPVIVTRVLVFEHADGSQLLGYAQGMMALGGIAGGIISAVVGERLRVESSWKTLLGTCILLVPVSLTLLINENAWVSYIIICICCSGVLVLATMFSIGMMAYVQRITPEKLIGKVIAWIMAIYNCSQPVGQAMYGTLFEKLEGREWIIFLFALAAAGVLTWKFYRYTHGMSYQK